MRVWGLEIVDAEDARKVRCVFYSHVVVIATVTLLALTEVYSVLESPRWEVIDQKELINLTFDGHWYGTTDGDTPAFGICEFAATPFGSSESYGCDWTHSFTNDPHFIDYEHGIYFQNKCYARLTTPSNMNAIAKRDCENLKSDRSGHLVSIGSVEENEVVRRVCGLSICWIGLTHAGPKADSGWTWFDGNTLVFANWQYLEPCDRKLEDLFFGVSRCDSAVMNSKRHLDYALHRETEGESVEIGQTMPRLIVIMFLLFPTATLVLSYIAVRRNHPGLAQCVCISDGIGCFCNGYCAYTTGVYALAPTIVPNGCLADPARLGYLDAKNCHTAFAFIQKTVLFARVAGEVLVCSLCCCIIWHTHGLHVRLRDPIRSGGPIVGLPLAVRTGGFRPPPMGCGTAGEEEEQELVERSFMIKHK